MTIEHFHFVTLYGC